MDVDFKKYRILGACNPGFVHKALLKEDKIGTMLPCIVIVEEHDNGKVEISAVDPMASMQAVENDGLKEIATQVRDLLEKVIKNIYENPDYRFCCFIDRIAIPSLYTVCFL